MQRFQKLCITDNIDSGTDLFVAASKGLGFYNFTSITNPLQIILPDINFKKVVSAEAIESLETSTQTNLTIFAVSEHDELYYIEGTRQIQTNVIQFQASGIPIRTDVDRISAQYNKKVNASEIIYVGNAVNEVRHLWKDPVTMLWQEGNIPSSQVEILKVNALRVHTILRIQ